MERIYPTNKEIDKCIQTRRLDNHIERYLIIKRYCFGKVLDLACGIGYGCYILENNPDIESILGVDIDYESIRIANNQFATEKVKFELGNILNYNQKHDVLVSLETIEHVKNLDQYFQMIQRVDPKIIILSFPNKKSTHFNKFHEHDLNSQQIVKLIKGYVLVNQTYQHDITIMVFIKSPEGLPDHLFDTIV